MKMLLFGLYTVGTWAVGFLIGVITKQIIDRDALRTLQRDNAKLHRQIAQSQKVERIEIIDNRAEPESYFVPF